MKIRSRVDRYCRRGDHRRSLRSDAAESEERHPSHRAADRLI